MLQYFRNQILKQGGKMRRKFLPLVLTCALLLNSSMAFAADVNETVEGDALTTVSETQEEAVVEEETQEEKQPEEFFRFRLIRENTDGGGDSPESCGGVVSFPREAECGDHQTFCRTLPQKVPGKGTGALHRPVARFSAACSGMVRCGCPSERCGLRAVHEHAVLSGRALV